MKSIKNTTINVGLLSAPVKIFAATSKEPEVSFKYCASGGRTVKQMYVTDTGETIAYDDLYRAFNGTMIPKAKLTEIEQESLKDEEGNSLESLRIQGFIPLKDVPMHRVTGAYLIGPNLKASDGEAFEILVAALKRKKVAAIAKMVLKSRQKLMALFVKDDLLHAVCLSFAAQVNNVEEAELRANVKPRPKLLTMMGTMIDAMGESAEMIDAQEDTFVAAKKALVEEFIGSGGVTVKEIKAKGDGAHSGLAEALEESMKVLADKGKVPA